MGIGFDCPSGCVCLAQPIRGQTLRHMIFLNQSEASIAQSRVTKIKIDKMWSEFGRVLTPCAIVVTIN